MSKARLPIWLTGRDQAVANALIADSFKYLGCPLDPEDMLAPERVGDWYLSPVHQEPMLEACHHYGALFRKDYAEDYSNLNDAEYQRVRELIAKSQLLAEV